MVRMLITIAHSPETHQPTFHDDDSEDDLAPLKPNECDVLAVVKSPAARYSIFLEPGKLDWGCSLKIGDKVSVETPIVATAAGNKIRAFAVVRYVGPVTALPGITFGVEIMVCPYLTICSLASSVCLWLHSG